MTYESIRIDSQTAMETPSVEYFRENGVYAYSSLIPQTYTEAFRIHFVCDSNGNEYGQYLTQEAATKKALKMAKLPEIDRKKYDI